MSYISSLIKFAAGVTWIAVSRVLFFFIFGLLLNVVLWWNLPDLCNTSDPDVHMVAKTTACSFSFVISVLFLLVFPVLYLVLGYRHSIWSTARHVYSDQKEKLFRYTTNRFVRFKEKSETETNGKEDEAENGHLLQLATNFFDKLDGMPFVFRGVMSLLKRFVPFADIVDKISQEVDLSNESNEKDFASRLSAAADDYVKEDILNPGWIWPLVLLLINAGLFLGITLIAA